MKIIILLSVLLCCSALADGYVTVTNGSTVIGAGSGGGGSQTPWTSDINGGGFQLTNVGNITSTGQVVAGGTGHYLAATNGGSYGNYGTGASNTDGYVTTGSITGATVTATGFFEGSGAHLTGLPSSGIPQNAGFGTNTTIYGDSNKTNALVVFPGGEIASNAVGTVTIGSGAVAASGNITSTNGQFVGNGAGITNLTVGDDPTDETTIRIDEEFLNASSTSASIGAYGWFDNVGISGSTFSGNLVSTAGHPGQITITTGATAGAGGAVMLGDNGSATKYQFVNLNTQVPWKFRIIFKLSNTNSAEFESGLIYANFGTTNTATSIIGVKFDATLSSALTLATGDGTVATTNLVANMVAGTWYDVLVGSVVAGTVYAQANGGSFVTNTTHCPSAGISPAFRVASQVGSQSAVLTIDAWKGLISQPTRYP